MTAVNIIRNERLKRFPLAETVAVALVALVIACSSPGHLPVDAHPASTASVSSPLKLLPEVQCR